jgi:hypothetical protein
LRTIDNLVERITGQEVNSREQIAPRLKVAENDDDWSILHLYTLTTQMRALPTQIPTLIAQLQNQIDHVFIREGLTACRDPELLRQYNENLRLYTQWFRDVPTKKLDSKGDWEMGFGLLTRFCASLVTLGAGAKAGKDIARNLRRQFAKGNVDAAATVSQAMEKRIFRTRQPGELPEYRRRDNQRSWNNPQRKEGTTAPTGQTGERKCRFCQLWHVGDWRLHKCKQ